MLRVMTFNIRGAYASDGENIWERRAPLTVETIKHWNPDLIGFQELQRGNLEVFQSQLSEYHYQLGPSIGEAEPYVYNAIFWKPDRLTSLNSGGFWLSRTPGISSYGWGAACIRALNWMNFQIADSQHTFLHLNTHLDHIQEQARINGTRLILQHMWQWLEEHGEQPVIATGDFNCDPGSLTHQRWLDKKFTDTFLATGHEDSMETNTFHAYGWSKQASSGKVRTTEIMRIDWILLRDSTGAFHPLSNKIIRDAQPPVYPSDHYPVVTDFTVNSGI